MAFPCEACEVRHLAVCSVLERGELPQIAAIRSTADLQRGETVIHEGEPADSVFVVTGGTLQLYKLLHDGRRQVVGFLFPGDFLGLTAGGVHACSAEAVTHLTLCRFPRRRLEALLRRLPKLEGGLLATAGRALAAAQDQILLLGRKTAEERVASFLLMLYERAARGGMTDGQIPIPMRRSDIADYLGLTTETVSRILSRFRRERVIRDLPCGRTELGDPDRLRALTACPDGGWAGSPGVDPCQARGGPRGGREGGRDAARAESRP